MNPAVGNYRQMDARERLIYELAPLGTRGLRQAARALWLVRENDVDPEQLEMLSDDQLVAYIAGDRA